VIAFGSASVGWRDYGLGVGLLTALAALCQSAASFASKARKYVYRLETISGRTWRMSSWPLMTDRKDDQGKPIVGWADGWEEMPESREAALVHASVVDAVKLVSRLR
jgi:hypothetical protein